jgi:hypothetical protein
VPEVSHMDKIPKAQNTGASKIHRSRDLVVYRYGPAARATNSVPYSK